MHKYKNPIFISSIILMTIAVIFTSGYTYKCLSQKTNITTPIVPTVCFKQNNSVEINSSVNLLSFVENINNGYIYIADSNINTSELGEKPLWVAVKSNDGNITVADFKVNIIDSTPPDINYKEKLYTTVGNKINLLKNVTVKDNSLENIAPVVEGEYSFNTEGTYNLKYSAKDSSGNVSSVNFKLIVSPNIPSAPVIAKDKPYHIVINREHNVVTVYTLSENKEYTVPIKTFVCSAGVNNNTPLGTYSTSDKYIWKGLIGGVYGQYSTRITGGILFHSVPYYTKSKDNIEYKEYNKLGTNVSLGCIRLTVSDAKWIYDNCEKGTTVTVCEGPLPNGITKPVPILIDITSKNRGWDPTDPDIANPYNK